MHNIQNYIDNCDSLFIPIVIRIRSIIKSTIPDIEEKLSYGVPFFYHHGPLCYINVRKKCIDLGFTKGYALSNKQGVLESKNRKQVPTISFYNESEIDELTIKEILFKAATLNEFKFYTKKG